MQWDAEEDSLAELPFFKDDVERRFQPSVASLLQVVSTFQGMDNLFFDSSIRPKSAPVDVLKLAVPGPAPDDCEGKKFRAVRALSPHLLAHIFYILIHGLSPSKESRDSNDNSKSDVEGFFRRQTKVCVYLKHLMVIFLTWFSIRNFTDRAAKCLTRRMETTVLGVSR
jgi:hypothetical protein